MLRHAGQDWSTISTLNVIGCHPPGNAFPGSPEWRFTDKATALEGVNYCVEHHMRPGLARANRARVLAVGGQALFQLTGKSGINTWRGSPLPLRGGNAPSVMPVIHPAALMRQAKLVGVTVGDLRKGLRVPPENYNLFPSLQDLQRFKSRVFAYDLEWDRNGITVCGLSDRFYGAIVVPWVEPYITELRRIFESATTLIGHNIINADNPWLERLGWDLSGARMEDTMLKQHLCQPGLPHDLGFVASVFTGKVFWKGKGWEEIDEDSSGEEQPGQQWRTWDRADALPIALGGYGGARSAQEAFCLYNARDTDAEFQINTPLDQMLRKWDLVPVYENVSRPAAYICREIGERGLRIDTSRLAGLRAGIDTKIATLEARLPEGLAPYIEQVSCNLPAPEGTYKVKKKICKGTRKEPHEPNEILFSNPTAITCPRCDRSISPGVLSLAKIVKGTRPHKVVPYNSPPKVQAYVSALKLQEVRDRKTGNLTTGKQARGYWAKDHPEFTLLGSLKEQVTLRNNFAKESLLGLDRMFFNLKVHGTNEGRLSSSGRRRGIDLNIQNQPREFRSIYIPEREDWGFINIDISQGESWLTCWLAKDWDRWAKLQTPGYDEHSELASAIFGKSITKAHAKPSYWAKLNPEWSPEQCEGESLAWDALRQVGKKTNHASAYGMGYKTYHDQLVTAGYTQFTQSDTKEFLETWKRLNPGTVLWQRETVGIANRQGFLRNPFGRLRWFNSRDSGTQCLAFLPASCLADMVIRMMIAHYPLRFAKELLANHTEVYHELVPEWIMSIMVHDSLVLQGPWDSREEQRERSTQIMCQPFAELDGFHFLCDTKMSQVSWGDC